MLWILKILRKIENNVYYFQLLKSRCLSLTYLFVIKRINPEKLIDVQKKIGIIFSSRSRFKRKSSKGKLF